MRFAIRYEGWHTCGRDSVRTVRRLAQWGLLEIQEYGKKALPQFRLAKTPPK